MKKKLLSLFVFLFYLSSFSQNIRYLVSFPNAVHHEANIQLVARDIPKGPAIFRMSRSSPGRYATHEFGKNVYNVKAYDQKGKSMPIVKVEGDVYRVPQQNGYVNVSYTLYANYPDGTYAGIDESSIHLNMPAAFLWMKGMDNAPIEIFFDIPPDKNWRIATQLKPTRYWHTFTAPGLQYFMDSPVKIGDLVIKEWTIANPDSRSFQFRLALEAKTDDSTAEAFAGKLGRIVKQAQAIYGELPNYDYGTYTFLASLNPWVKGDGMEHRNSTMICRPVAFDGSDGLLDVFAHEFFHCWNVERIRPKSLEPFNFEKSNMSSELWFAEGFTQYYGDLITLRSGFTSIETYLPWLAATINTKMVSPGGKFHSPAENSQMAVFVDAGVAIDKTNYPNIFASYYSYGAAIALALDLELRINFKLSLDDYMKAVWRRFGKTEIPYTIPGLQQVLEKLTSKEFAADFFSKYIKGHDTYDYATSLHHAGLILKRASEGKAWIGNVRYMEGEMLTIASNTIMGTPWYEAGLDIDDQLISVDGKAVKKQNDLTDILQQHKPGEKIDVAFKHHGEQRNTKLTTGESPASIVMTMEANGETLTEDEKHFREEWLGNKIKL